ncbi:MAG: hypothetical protein Q8930_07135 [Bacillota bacterium]|nr:hypothetical protein [Bacillota bacterium]
MFGRKKYAIVLILCLLSVFAGIASVNVEYNRMNGNANDEAVYANVFDDGRSRSDLYGEVVLDRKKDTKLRIYYSSSPFDLRFTVGNKIFYINGSIFKGLKEKINSNKSEANSLSK